MKTLKNAETAKEVEELIDKSVLEKIPTELVQEITENILLFERYYKGEIFITPQDVEVTRIYSETLNKIVQIDYKGISYKN